MSHLQIHHKPQTSQTTDQLDSKAPAVCWFCCPLSSVCQPAQYFSAQPCACDESSIGENRNNRKL